MKLSTTLALAVCLSSIAAQPVRAGWRWPALGGEEFCSLRRIGADHQSALKAAIAEGYDDNWQDSIQITIGEQTFNKGLIDFYQYVKNQCPYYYQESNKERYERIFKEGQIIDNRLNDKLEI